VWVGSEDKLLDPGGRMNWRAGFRGGRFMCARAATSWLICITAKFSTRFEKSDFANAKAIVGDMRLDGVHAGGGA
jgi:hypothetical protein